MKHLSIIFVVIILIVGGVVYLLTQGLGNEVPVSQEQKETTDVVTTTTEDMTQTEELKEEDEVMQDDSIIGKSVEGRDIGVYHYGTGDTELLFVGGIHGGYEWNTVLVAYELMDYLEANPDVVPENMKVTVIPVLNPDGLDEVVDTDGRFSASDVPSEIAQTVQGRFNANDVDLNRNFDCNWQSTGTWQNTTVSGGTEAFSEPESQAMKAYIEAHNPKAVVVWYSAAGGVFASSCNNGVLPETSTLTKVYATASGYKAYNDFNFYDITGDMVNWLAKKNIPAISVLLTTHTGTEWSKNKSGIEALIKHYTE